MSGTPSVDQTASAPGTARPPAGHSGWKPARVIAVVAGGLVGLTALATLSVGGWATWMTNAQRDASGYVNADRHTITTAGHAITSPEVGELADKTWGGLLGTVRLRATSTSPGAVFIGVAPAAAVDRYLAGADRTTVTGWFPVATHDVAGTGAAPTPPTNSQIWTKYVSGPGTQALSWRPKSGTTVVVMRPDGSTAVSAAIDVGATVPDLSWLAAICFVVGILLLGAAAALVLIPVLRSRR